MSSFLHVAPPFPLLPPPPSWFPGHMARFNRMLPALLSRTDVVLELRDARLPLTSVNRSLEGALRRWKTERGRLSASATFPRVSGMPPSHTTPHFSTICERVVVLNKRDLVPEWGLEPFRRAMTARFPEQKFFFASWRNTKDLRDLNELLVNIARQHPAATELNVLVIGMPNVGKSTLLNALRTVGIKGPTSKALRTSAHPGLTRVLSTRLKISAEPLVYAYDSPGVMLPFLGHGDKGAERGVKLALIAGIKESLYDVESLAAYLLYRLNILNPDSPAYLRLLPPSAQPTADIVHFLEQLAQRLGMLRRGGVKDVRRAAAWFVKWWREEGGLLSASCAAVSARGPSSQMGWGFDLEWAVREGESEGTVQSRMAECIERFVVEAEAEERYGGEVSVTQERRRLRLETAGARAGLKFRGRGG